MAPGRSSIGDLDPAALVRNSDRLMVIARPSGHAIPLVTSLASAVVEVGRQEARRALAQGGRLDPPLLLLLDEVCKVCRLPQLPELVTDCASQGIVVVYALQSLEDGRTAWGPTRFGGMWSATNCHLVMGQVSSAETLRDRSDLSPTVRVEDPREARNARGERLGPVVRYERALTTDELSALPALSGIAFYGRRPMRLDMPHVASPQSEVQVQALFSKAAWLRWVTEHQSLRALGRGAMRRADGTMLPLPLDADDPVRALGRRVRTLRVSPFLTPRASPGALASAATLSPTSNPAPRRSGARACAPSPRSP